MKKNVTYIATAVVIAGAGLTFWQISKIPTTPRVATEGIKDSATKKAIHLLQDKGCLSCHSSKAEVPFYGSLPGIKNQIKKDMDEGLRAADLQTAFETVAKGGVFPEATLAKIEHVIASGTMPPSKFSMIHRSSKIDDSEKKTLLDWISATRLTHYTTYGKDRKFASEPIQPIVDQVTFDAAKAKLGFKLYHDTRLSGDNTLSCASCHNLATGVDNAKVSTGINGQKGGINAPTVLNATFNFCQFWDGRAKDLQEQAGGPPLNPIEMGSKSWDDIVAKLNADTDFKSEFSQVYPKGFSGETITDAIAEFERTLVTPDSPFDLYLKGDENAVSNDVKEGYRLFKENKCASCHVGQAMGGQSFEYMGLKADYFADRGGKETDADKGRFNVTKDPRDLHKFKTPLLRNIALTAPYFHDASAATLEDAVKVMLKYQVGKTLSDDEVGKIVAFLKAQTGKPIYKKLIQ